MAYANDLSNAIANSTTNLWDKVMSTVPNVIGAILIFFIGWFIASALGRLAEKLILTLKIDEMADRLGVTSLFKEMHWNIRFSTLIGWAVKWFLIIVVLIAASDVLGWSEVTQFLNQVALYIPNVIVAIIIMAIGLVAGRFIEDLVIKGLSATNMPAGQSRGLGTVAKIAIVVFAVFASLTQLGIAEQLIQILFGGLVLALALAFGLGGREKAAQWLDRLDASVNPRR